MKKPPTKVPFIAMEKLGVEMHSLVHPIYRGGAKSDLSNAGYTPNPGSYRPSSNLLWE
jgi:hypothetical protein